jgi:hypothetical protein
VHDSPFSAASVIRFENTATGAADGLRLDFLCGDVGADNYNYGVFQVNSPNHADPSIFMGSGTHTPPRDLVIFVGGGEWLRFKAGSPPPFFFSFGGATSASPAFKRDTLAMGIGTYPAWSARLGNDSAYCAIKAGTLGLGFTDTPADAVATVFSNSGFFTFKDAAGSIQYGGMGGGDTHALGAFPAFRVFGNPASARLVLAENGEATVIGGPLLFHGITSGFAGIIYAPSDPTSIRARFADDSAFTDIKGRDLYANQNGESGGVGKIFIGGLDSARQFGGIWVGNQTATFSNYVFLGNDNGATATTLFNTPSYGLIEFRVANATKFIVGPQGVSINTASGTVPTIPFLVKNAAQSTILLTISDAGNIDIGATSTAINSKVRVRAIGANAIEFQAQSPSETCVAIFTPTTGNIWSMGAGQVDVGDFGFGNTTTGTTPLRMKANGQVVMPLLGAFAGGDKYVTIDASGNLHVSATGPAS